MVRSGHAVGRAKASGPRDSVSSVRCQLWEAPDGAAQARAAMEKLGRGRPPVRPLSASGSVCGPS